MSGSYTRVIPRPIPIKCYGFKKVSAEELQQIVKRVQKMTYCTTLYNGEKNPRSTSPPRPPSSVCRRAMDRRDDIGFGPKKQPFDPRLILRINRRLQRPTICRKAYRGIIVPEHEREPERAPVARPKTASENRKVLERVRRPTTASKSKLYAPECVFCDDPTLEDCIDDDYSDDHVVSPDQLDIIIKRVQSPTVASRAGRHKSANKKQTRATSAPMIRKTQNDNNSHNQRVDSIVDRLYRPTLSMPICKTKPRTPAATQTCIF